eukprot:7036747-Pyramimonas_sp.AAC.1
MAQARAHRGPQQPRRPALAMAHGRAASPRHCGPSPQTRAHGWHGPCPGQRRLSFSASCRGLGSHRRGYQA